MSGELTGFNPDWTLAPAATLADWLAERHIDVSGGHALAAGEYARHYFLTGWWIDAINATWAINWVMDRQPVTQQVADRLELLTSAPARFWLRYDAIYRADLAAGRTDITPRRLREAPDDDDR